ncbi:MAG: FAD-dependent oxidoreductase [Candidatus Xenobia bacterium]
MDIDTLILGSDPNALACAASLANQGQKVVILERRDSAGGVFAREGGLPWRTPLRPRMRRELGLLDEAPLDPVAFCPLSDGNHFTLWQDVEKTRQELARLSQSDAQRYAGYKGFMDRMIAFAEPLLDQTPVGPDAEHWASLVDAANIGLRFKNLSQADALGLMRLGPMAVQDFLEEWFEHPAILGALAMQAFEGRFAGPRSPGTAATLLYHQLAGPRVAVGSVVEDLVAAGTRRGVEIRFGQELESILVEVGRCTGVRLKDGTVVRATRVVSALDPKRTFLELVPPLELGPEFVRNVANLKMRGSTALVRLKLSRAPRFACLGEQDPAPYLKGRIHFGPDIEALERAYDDVKYGKLSGRPVLEGRFSEPGQLDLRVKFVPFGCSEDVKERVLSSLEAYLPDLRECLQEVVVKTPSDFQAEYGLSGGHLHQGEHNLHQLHFCRPLPGYADYSSPVERLFLCGSGCHPGGVGTGAAGANAAREIMASNLDRAKSAVSTPVGAGLAVGTGVALMGVGALVASLVKKPKKEKGKQARNNGHKKPLS